MWGLKPRCVSGGIGTSPYAPYRFLCRPEATLLTLVAAPTGDADAARTSLGSSPAVSVRWLRVTTVAVHTGSRDWVNHAIRRLAADTRRSADTHLLRYPLPSAWCADVDIELYLRTSQPISPGASSIGWRARCSSTGCATAGSPRAPPWWRRPRVPRRSRRPISPHCSGCLSSRLCPRRPVRPRSPTSRITAAVAISSTTPPMSPTRPAGSPIRPGVFPGPVHQCRAGHRLARQQQHRRVDLRPDGRRATPRPDLDSGGRRNRSTSATIGRFIRYQGHSTRLCVADPENSAFFPAFAEGRRDIVTKRSSRIEGSAGHGSSRHSCPP